MRGLSLSRDVRGEDYDELLAWGVACFPLALLVVRPEMDLRAAGSLVLARLGDRLVSKSLSSSWPGTELLDSQAEVFVFSLAPETAMILSQSARGLFDWQQPDLPEDLCFLRKNLEPAVATTSHESFASFQLTDVELRRLKQEAPLTYALLEEARKHE